jgi:hypothetical protein
MHEHFHSEVEMRSHRNSEVVVIERAAAEVREALTITARQSLKSDPQDPALRQLAKDVRGGRLRPCQHLLMLVFAAIDDEAPIDDVLELPRRLEGLIRARYGIAPRRTLREICVAETRAQAPLDILEMRVGSAPTDSELVDLERAALKHIELLHELLAAVQLHRYGFVRSTRSLALEA